MRLDVEGGWGFAAMDGAGQLMPYAGLGLAPEDDRRYRMGLRLGLGLGISAELAAERAETDAEPRNAVTLRTTLRW